MPYAKTYLGGQILCLTQGLIYLTEDRVLSVD